MKRSEAIEEMEITWREYVDNMLTKDFAGVRNGMSLVLYKLEALGLLDPYHEVEVQTEEGFEFKRGFVRKGWEDE